MNRILVTGGTGYLGNLIVQSLKKKEYPVRILTTKQMHETENLVEYQQGDLANNINLETAVKNVDTIIHCASNPRDSDNIDIRGTQNFLTALEKQNIKHFLYISIVGVDKSDYPYYIAKYKAEQLIAGSGVPYTILRATQFHSFIVNLIQQILQENAAEEPLINLPDGMYFQPVDAPEVAELAVTLATAEPKGLYPDVGGPEVRSFSSLANSYFQKKGNNPELKFIPTDNVRHNLFRSGINLCPHNTFGKITWEKFLQRNYE
jgi:uncharacterized protein YbjT (DUF2867 family)